MNNKKIQNVTVTGSVPVRIGFNADPDPAFYLNADPDPGQTLPSQK